jgi:hypothetical protein
MIYEPTPGDSYSIQDVHKENLEIATAEDFGGAVLAYLTIIEEDRRTLRVIDSRGRDVTVPVGQAAIRRVLADNYGGTCNPEGCGVACCRGQQEVSA